MQDGVTSPNVLAKWFYEKWMDVQSGDYRQPRQAQQSRPFNMRQQDRKCNSPS